MKITKQTLLADAIYFLNADHWNDILNKVTDADIEVQGWQSLQSYTLGEFIELSQALERRDTAYIIGKFFPQPKRKWWQFPKKETTTLWEVAVRIKWLTNEVQTIGKYFEQLEIKQDADEKQAAQGINFLNSYISMLAFAQQKFFLHSLDEAEKVKLCDYMALKKQEVDGIKYQRTLQKIHSKKHSQKFK